MKLIISATILFFVFILLFESEKFELAYASLAASLLAGCVATYLGNKRTKTKEDATNSKPS
jgi:uncharacterized membrane protein YjjB (DUF3815 family)